MTNEEKKLFFLKSSRKGLNQMHSLKSTGWGCTKRITVEFTALVTWSNVGR